MQISHEAAHGATGCAGVCRRAAMLCCVSFTARLLDVLDAAVYFVECVVMHAHVQKRTRRKISDACVCPVNRRVKRVKKMCLPDDAIVHQSSAPPAVITADTLLMVLSSQSEP